MTAIPPDLEKLAERTSPLRPSRPDESYTGKLVGWLGDGFESVACLRIPRNGLWWYDVVDPESGLGGEDGFDDRWLDITGKPEVDRPSNRPLIGAWVKASAAPGSGGDFDLEQLPARRVEMVWHRHPRLPAEHSPYHASPSLDCPFFPDDPDLQAWSDRTFFTTLNTSIETGSSRNYGWTVLSVCTCGELGCRSVLIDLQPASDDTWLEWREVHGGDYWGKVLGPWLQVPARPRVVQGPPEGDAEEESKEPHGGEEQGATRR